MRPRKGKAQNAQRCGAIVKFQAIQKQKTGKGGNFYRNVGLGRKSKRKKRENCYPKGQDQLQRGEHIEKKEGPVDNLQNRCVGHHYAQELKLPKPGGLGALDRAKRKKGYSAQAAATQS